MLARNPAGRMHLSNLCILTAFFVLAGPFVGFPHTRAASTQFTASSVSTVPEAVRYDVQSLGLAISGGTAIAEGRVLFLVDEFAQGEADLNGDLDSQDRVLFVHELATETTRNLGLAVSGLVDSIHSAADTLVVLASELANQTDWNGDGDLFDQVLVRIDPVTGVIAAIETPFPSSFTASESWLAYTRAEAQVGSDLNGDGDQTDLTLALHDLASGTTTDLGIAAEALAFERGLLRFTVREAQQGLSDLNRDGDSTDAVVHAWDARRGMLVNLGLTDLDDWFVADDFALFQARETSEGFDSNGDGDAFDSLARSYDRSSGQLGTPLPFAIQTAGYTAIDSHKVAFRLHEPSQGADENGDADLVDTVAAVYDHALGTATSIGIAIAGDLAGGAGRLYLRLDENAQFALDRNADGDLADTFFVVWEEGSSVISARTAIGSIGVPSTGRYAVFARSELDEKADLNADGDLFDEVLQVFDPARACFTDLALARAGSGPDLYGHRLSAALVSEPAQELSLNPDADEIDTVLHLYDAAFGTWANTGLAVPNVLVTAVGNRAAVPVFENGQGFTDLNGDADTNDVVLYLIRLR